jgi:hypothetical protein
VKTFSVKNFERFQHYKDRSPPWIKLYNELLDDYEFGLLPDASKFHLIAIWLLASRSENKIPFDPVWVARRINASDKVNLQILAERGFILVDQVVHNAEHVASTPQAECLTREEKRRDRGETDSRSISDRLPDRFDDFWSAYPQREGANPRKPAETKFNALVKTGVDPEMLIAEAKKLASLEAGRGNIKTKFIPQAITWLNQQRWADHAAIAMLASEMPIKGFYAKAESEQLAAWDSYAIRTKGKGMPRDRNQGWRVDSEWPPDYQPRMQTAPPIIPMLPVA